MTEHAPENTQLFLTAPMPCPYLPGMMERKLFTHLTGRRAPALHALLSDNGFRRSQNLIYRPACEGCAACQSARILAREFEFTGRYGRILKLNDDIEVAVRQPRATVGMSLMDIVLVPARGYPLDGWKILIHPIVRRITGGGAWQISLGVALITPRQQMVQDLVTGTLMLRRSPMARHWAGMRA